jgi:hypothetical protein
MGASLILTATAAVFMRMAQNSGGGGRIVHDRNVREGAPPSCLQNGGACGMSRWPMFDGRMKSAASPVDVGAAPLARLDPSACKTLVADRDRTARR